MLTGYISPEEHFVTCPNQDVGRILAIVSGSTLSMCLLGRKRTAMLRRGNAGF
jgi:hypothetical protein